jgi:polyhydroxyalkanoate synthase
VLEDWANSGEPLPFPAAAELIEDLFGRDLPGPAQWQVGGQAVSDRLSVPALHILAGTDRIAPPSTAPAGPSVTIEAGHVGMVVGSARCELHQALRGFLDPACR